MKRSAGAGICCRTCSAWVRDAPCSSAAWSMASGICRDDLDAFLPRRRQSPDRHSIVSSDFDAGVCFGYLRLTTGSVWPATLAHSGFNIFWERFNGFTETRSPLVLEYLAGESGLLTLFALAVLAGWRPLAKTKQGCSRGRSFLTGLSPIRRPLLGILAIQILDFPLRLADLH